MVGAALCWPICGLQRARVNLSILFGAWGTSPDALVVIMPVLPVALGPHFLLYIYTICCIYTTFLPEALETSAVSLSCER